MVKKESRTKVREKKHLKIRNRSAAQLRDRDWQCSEATIICMLR